jgi:E3 ubiquitin-protein ligase SIAH1
MEELSRALGDALLRELECPLCMQYMVPPIKLCTNGHNICSRCTESVRRCPTCRTKFSKIRNVALENIATSQKYPCANRQSGCLELFSIEHIGKHNTVCVYGKIKCPLHSLQMCSWNGLKNDLKEHAKAAHPDHFVEVSSFYIPKLSETLAIVSCFGELFTYNQEIHDGRLYSAVQLIGTSSEASKYKCEFILRAENGIEQISKTFLVQGYSVEWETVFNSGKCLSLEEATARNFFVKKELNLAMKLSRV